MARKEITVSEVKRYHATEAGLVEGSALGRINVVLASDYDAAVTHIRDLELLAGQELKSTELATNAGLRVCLERDALQALLTAADERADTATSLIQRIVANFDTEIEFHEDVEPNDLEHDQVLAEMRVFLDTLKPAGSSGKPCACPGCDSPRRANSPFCVAHRSAKSRTRGQAPLTADGLEWLMQNDGLQQ